MNEFRRRVVWGFHAHSETAVPHWEWMPNPVSRLAALRLEAACNPAAQYRSAGSLAVIALVLGAIIVVVVRGARIKAIDEHADYLRVHLRE